jgi:outer membrane protein assembly factor BamA
MDMRYWAHDHIQTVFALVGASVNLDYFGTGDDSVLHDNPLRYNLKPVGVVAKAKYRFGDTRIWAGLGYTFATTAVTFAAPEGTPGLPDYESRSNIGKLSPFTTWDTRDNIFTPTRGTFLEATFDVATTWLGSDHDFQVLSLVAIQYFPLPHGLFLGVRADGGASFGNLPFYARPSIDLRGVSAMRYQGQEIAQLEAELRWQFYGRWSVLAFASAAGAWNHFEQFQNSQGIVAGGGGFRYEIARKYGIHMGIDVAGSRDTGALYIQVGSAWMRP